MPNDNKTSQRYTDVNLKKDEAIAKNYQTKMGEQLLQEDETGESMKVVEGKWEIVKGMLHKVKEEKKMIHAGWFDDEC